VANNFYILPPSTFTILQLLSESQISQLSINSYFTTVYKQPPQRLRARAGLCGSKINAKSVTRLIDEWDNPDYGTVISVIE